VCGIRESFGKQRVKPVGEDTHTHTVGALWDCVPRDCGGGGGCAGGGVPLGAVPALSWCGEVSLGGKHIIIVTHTHARTRTHPGGLAVA